MHYVIGDVHGCYDKMIQLVNKIESRDADAKIIFVGDFVDRGPDTMKCIRWAMDHITADGKYQSVRGNHEEMIIEWYEMFCKWYNNQLEDGVKKEDIEKGLLYMPQTNYDFSDLIEEEDMVDPKKIEPLIMFFNNLPLSKEITVTSNYGVPVNYKIVHAAYDHQPANERIFKDKCLWERDHRNLYNNDIIVHGHTPTISEYYPAVLGYRPGMICYDTGDVNVDGGCVFFKYEGNSYPCFLCAICLETLDEIYSSTLEEWAKDYAGDSYKSYLKAYKNRCRDFEHPYGRDELLLRLQGKGKKISGGTKWGHPMKGSE